MGPLIIFLLVDSSSDPLQDFPLELSHQLDHQVITRLHRKVKKKQRKVETLCNLLQGCKSTRPEEDDGVAEPISLPVEADLVEESVGRDFVVLRRVYFSRSKGRVSVSARSLLKHNCIIICKKITSRLKFHTQASNSFLPHLKSG